MDQPHDTHASLQPAIRVTRLTPSVQEARRTLARLLTGQPPPDQHLAAAAALATLEDTGEVTPPLVDDVDPLPWDEGHPLALTQLGAAIDEASTIEELTRVATAALELRSVPPEDRDER
jgi:hypothetical protein